MTATDPELDGDLDLTSPVTADELVPLEEHCEWTSDTLGERYVFELTDAHVAELDAALVHAEAVAADVLDITRDDFPLPTLGPELARLTRELIEGDGVALEFDRIVDGRLVRRMTGRAIRAQ